MSDDTKSADMYALTQDLRDLRVHFEQLTNDLRHPEKWPNMVRAAEDLSKLLGDTHTLLIDATTTAQRLIGTLEMAIGHKLPHVPSPTESDAKQEERKPDAG